MITRRSCRLPPTPSLSERKRTLFPELSPSSTATSSCVSTSHLTTSSTRQSGHVNIMHPNKDEEKDTSVHNFYLNEPRSPIYLSGDSSDLGHMSPLEISSSPEHYDSPYLDSPKHLLARPRFFSPKCLTFENILSRDDSNNSSASLDNSPVIRRKNLSEKYTKDCTELLSKQNHNFDENSKENYGDDLSVYPLISPTKSNNVLTEMVMNQNEDTIVPETPEKMSPTQILRTPQEIPLNPSPPKLNARRSFVELNLGSPVEVDIYPQKRPREDSGILTNSPRRKQFKVEDIPKARAALFVDTNTSISPKSFYSNKPQPTVINRLAPKFHVRAHRPARNSSSRKSHRRISKIKKFGEINFGVRHGIRKPKTRKPIVNESKASVLRTLINVNSPLKDRLEVLGTKTGTPRKINKSLPETQLKKMDGLLKRLSTKVSPSTSNSLPSRSMKFSISLNPLTNETLDEVKTENVPVRKFFKSKRSYSNKVINLQDNIHINISDRREAQTPLMKKPKLEPNLEDSQILDSSQDLSAEQHEVSKLLAEWTESDEEEERETYQLPENSDLDLQTIQTELEIIDLKLAALQQSNTLFDMDTKDFINNSNTVDNINIDNLNTSGLIDLTTTQNDLVYQIPVDNVLLSPTSQISDMTSVLALNSPRPPIHISNLQSNMETEIVSTNTKEQKLFPLFYKGNCQAANIPIVSSTREKNIWKPNGQSQLQIDAGQKNFGLTQCHECTLVYQIGEPEDEILHERYHNSYHVLKFKGWRNEKLVCTVGNLGRILHVPPNSNKAWLRRVLDLLDVVDRDLGFVRNENEKQIIGDAQVFLMADSKQILGMIMAVPLSFAHKLLTVGEIQCCSLEAYPVKCGVSRIWVAASHRRKGIAKALLNAVRFNFQFGAILSISDIAFSTPTPDGQALARNFSGVDDFMVFSNL